MARTPQVVLDAIFPRRVVVAGLTLQPFTMAHFLVLERLKSPVVSGAEDLIGEDVLRALVVLAMTGEEALAATDEQITAAIATAAARMNVSDLLPIATAVRTHVDRGFATQPARYDNADGGGEDRPFARVIRKAQSALAGLRANWRRPQTATRANCAPS